MHQNNKQLYTVFINLAPVTASSCTENINLCLTTITDTKRHWQQTMQTEKWPNANQWQQNNR